MDGAKPHAILLATLDLAHQPAWGAPGAQDPMSQVRSPVARASAQPPTYHSNTYLTIPFFHITILCNVKHKPNTFKTKSQYI